MMPTRGEKRMCKNQGQGRGDRRDKDDHDGRGGDGQRRTERNISRENFLALPAPPSSSTPRNGKEVKYIPYEEGSGKKFKGYNIPPFWKKKSNRDKIDYQWGQNKRIEAKRKEVEEILEI
nr:probable ATP-dependent helicase PF08_0048 [Ipomoea batatas]